MTELELYSKIVPNQITEAYLQFPVLASDTEITFNSASYLTSEWGFILFTGVELYEKPTNECVTTNTAYYVCGSCGNKQTISSECTSSTTTTNTGCNTCTHCGNTTCDDCNFCDVCEDPIKYIMPKCPKVEYSKAELVLYKKKTIKQGCYPNANQLIRGLDIVSCDFTSKPSNIKDHGINELVLINDSCYLHYRFDCILRNYLKSLT